MCTILRLLERGRKFDSLVVQFQGSLTVDVQEHYPSTPQYEEHTDQTLEENKSNGVSPPHKSVY